MQASSCVEFIIWRYLRQALANIVAYVMSWVQHISTEILIHLLEILICCGSIHCINNLRIFKRKLLKLLLGWICQIATFLWMNISWFQLFILSHIWNIRLSKFIDWICWRILIILMCITIIRISISHSFLPANRIAAKIVKDLLKHFAVLLWLRLDLGISLI